ncbi:membrane-associated zinc metalloprotease, S2P/M50 family [Campylobacter mucosalis]|uniref:site-2 protease family protein n=1 Tax=Campylobacter mucosalis TaxID=202 RepID=UPI0015948D92|nr:site-2 protease family protein [Campylobacter mucosalis]QKF63324.1 membrane-associated zinc metalloprotease, S2P/M50 family [Campylobacter mucosalis]
MEFTNIAQQIVPLVLALVIAIVGHEIMHGWVAYKFGDHTAKNQNRLSINPIRHIDPIGTILVPAVLYFSSGLLFGWAKPVPVNMSVVIRNGGYKAGIFVALAGIFYNIFLAIFSIFILLHFGENFSEIVVKFFFILFSTNLFLGLFNLYPIPPLDGSKALIYVLLSLGFKDLANKIYSLERYGMIILIVILISPLSSYFFMPIRYVFKMFVGII